MVGQQHLELDLRGLGSRSISIPASSEWRVLDVMRHIEDAEGAWHRRSISLAEAVCAGIPLPEQRLIFHGRQLQRSRRLSEYSISDRSTIRFGLRLRGGAPKKKKKKDGDDGETLSRSTCAAHNNCLIPAGAGELTPEEVQEIAKLRIQFLERELSLWLGLKCEC